MREKIKEKLAEIERQENIRILHAVESGSRAWGFPSKDSDYDVRFIYVRPLKYYLKLGKTRDVIEQPIRDCLDINGWDLKKALQLLDGANPTLFEWMSSPIVYQETGFADAFRPLLKQYFSPQKALWHYISMADNNIRTFLEGDRVRAKKYLYALRPVLACRWVLEHQTPPPMLFSALVDRQLPPALRPLVERLLDIKMNTPEIKDIPRIDGINRYLEENIAQIKACIPQISSTEDSGWEPLDRFFCQIVQ